MSHDSKAPSQAARIATMACLILAGEAVFSLPFHVTRYFRATALDVFGFSNTQLGDVFFVYGVAAMAAYLLGGPIADRFSARRLMAVSLFATGIGGFYMASIPSATGMAVLYGYWGVTSVLLFWAPMLRETRQWGGTLQQGRAFGILDGGRGAVSAGMATLAVVLFSFFFPSETDAVSAEERRAALQSVIHFYVALTLGAGVVCWIGIPDSDPAAGSARTNPLEGILGVVRTPSVWAIALIVVCAYCGYKGLDNYSLYAVQVLGMDEVEAAQFATWGAYIRPPAAIAAGFLADRLTARHVIGGLFAGLTLSYAVLWQAAPSPEFIGILYANLFVSFVGVYGLRGVYFATLEEARVPRIRTGAAVGLVSLVGYTPDVFYAPIAGRLLDRSPGIAGHQHNFLLLAAIASAGLVMVLVLRQLALRQQQSAAD